MTKKQTTTVDKIVYAFLIFALTATVVISFLGGQKNNTSNINNITERKNLIPIQINQVATIILTKGDNAGRSHSLRWFEKVLVTDLQSSWLTESLDYYCKQENIISFIKKYNGNFNIRFITKNNLITIEPQPVLITELASRACEYNLSITDPPSFPNQIFG